MHMNTDTTYWIYLRKTKCMHAHPEDARPRCSKKRRVDIFNQLLQKGFRGDALEQMTKLWSKIKRFSVVRLAKVSDMDSTGEPQNWYGTLINLNLFFDLEVVAGAA